MTGFKPRLLAALTLLSLGAANLAADESVKPTSAAGKPAAQVADPKPAEIGEAEQLSFRQAKVAAEMTELEARMFRLAETLRPREPDNASRLMQGLKYARDETILQQMKETQDALAKTSLKNATAEQKQLVAKLQRLEQLLLSPDLDFQMRLARLREIRKINALLDTTIKEEGREQRRSQETAELERQLEQLKKRQATLEDLIERQTAHITDGQKLAEQQEPAADDATRLANRQSAAQKDTKQLGAGKQPNSDAKDTDNKLDGSNLDEAAGKMGSAVDALQEKATKPAVGDMRQALTALEKERAASKKQLERLARELAAEKFAAMRKDQQGNHQATDGISDMVRQLGDSGAGALKDLGQAGASMSGAESDLASLKAGSAGDAQAEALAALQRARQQLDEEANRLLDELRGEVKKRVIEGLTLMLEQQVSVRERTALLGPRVAEGSRQALSSVVALAKAEGSIVDLASELVNLVEETEFGIALPAALGSVRGGMQNVQASLARGEATPPVIAAERQIEADIELLLAAMKQMPAARPPSGKPKRGSPDEERELNRLVAELKMIRLLQTRVNKDTINVDSQRAAAAMSTAIKKQIEGLQHRQESVRDVTEKLAEKRGDEVR